MRILVVDDQERLRFRLGEALRKRGHAVEEADSHDAALAAIPWAPTHAVVDLKLGDDDGLRTLEALHRALPDLGSVLLTGYGSIATAVAAVKLGATDVLQKPADADQILAALEGRSTEPTVAPPSLARAEWEHIQRVLADCDGNISEAARRLGLHRRTLQRKLAKYPPRT